MTTYYVDPVNGNNANNGLGPDASHASNKPFATIGKLIAASGVMVSGDVAYLAPGTYREVVAVGVTSPVAETSIIGDPANAQGFKTSGGVLVAPADVIWSAYTTNDTTAPSTSPNVDLAGRDFLAFEKIVFQGSASTSSGSIVRGSATNSLNITLRDCTLIGIGTGALVVYIGLADIAANWVIDRCIFYATNPTTMFLVTLPTSASADYDSNILVRNSLFIGASGQHCIDIGASGALSFKGGGIDALNCIFICGSTGMRTSSANISTGTPCTVNNSLIIACAVGLNANTIGQITEDYCRILCSTARTNVTAGANSVSTNAHALMMELGQSLFMGRTQRPFLSPAANSPLLGFGSTGAPSVDISNRTRPAGGASVNNAVGAFERHDTAVQETSITQTGSSAIKITGPGDHQFQIPVDAVSTVISIYVRYDTNHGTGTNPQAILLTNGAIGVTTETKTATVGVDTWEQLTFAAQTPSAKGVVTIRLISRAAAGNGIAYFDTAAVA